MRDKVVTIGGNKGMFLPSSGTQEAKCKILLVYILVIGTAYIYKWAQILIEYHYSLTNSRLHHNDRNLIGTYANYLCPSETVPRWDEAVSTLLDDKNCVKISS